MKNLTRQQIENGKILIKWSKQHGLLNKLLVYTIEDINYGLREGESPYISLCKRIYKNDISSFFFNAFTWSQTVEGHAYWSNIDNMFSTYIYKGQY